MHSQPPIPSLGSEPGVYDPVRTAWSANINRMNGKGQFVLVDGTLVETLRPSWQTAARTGDFRLISTHIEEMQDHPHGINFTEPNGYTCLAVAATYNQVELVKMLITRGVDINAQNNWKDTALHRAAEHGFSKLVQILLDAGADPLLEDWVRRPIVPQSRATQWPAMQPGWSARSGGTPRTRSRCLIITTE